MILIENPIFVFLDIFDLVGYLWLMENLREDWSPACKYYDNQQNNTARYDTWSQRSMANSHLQMKEGIQYPANIPRYMWPPPDMSKLG